MNRRNFSTGLAGILAAAFAPAAIGSNVLMPVKVPVFEGDRNTFLRLWLTEITLGSKILAISGADSDCVTRLWESHRIRLATFERVNTQVYQVNKSLL